MTIFLHGGLICPAELAALAASMPFALAVLYYVRCRGAGLYERLRRVLRRWPWRRKPSNPYWQPGGETIKHEATLTIRVTPNGPAKYKQVKGRSKR